MYGRRLLTACAAFGVGVVGGVSFAGTAWAAAPANDDIGGAVVISAVPFTYTESTVEATTSADETAVNEFCGAPALEHGVWFTATPAQSGFVAADVTASSYSAGIAVLSGTPGNLTPLLCGPGQVAGFVNAGETMFLLVFGDGLTAETSGDLVLSVTPAVAPPTIDLAVDRFGTADKQGNAQISGSVTCTSEDGSGTVVDVFGQMRQTVGRFFINGSFDTFVGAPCDGSASRWTAFVASDNGKFAGGKAATLTFAFGCTDFCNETYVEATVQLRRSGK